VFVEMEAPFMAPYSEDWRTIAEQASREMDPKRLAALVSQLCCAFDERDKLRRETRGLATVVKSTANPALSRSALPNLPA
jgi:hypothetical protein